MNRSLFTVWSKITSKSTHKKIIVNFGPQHPAAHGVLRLVLQLNGEIIQKCDIHIGLLHRGSESLITTKHVEKAIPYFDRFDYVSMMSQEHAFCLGIEYLLGTFNTSKITSYIRILFDELTRIMNHMLAVACHALDIGSMSSIFWAFEEREKLMSFYEEISGARMHAAYHKFYPLEIAIPTKQLLIDVLLFTTTCFKTLNEMHNVLTYNKIWKQRLLGIGILSIFDCQNYSLTGVMSRSVGLRRDLRISPLDTYSQYSQIVVRSFVGVNGDTYDRYLIRMLEMAESLNIITQVTTELLKLTEKTTNLTTWFSSLDQINDESTEITISESSLKLQTNAQKQYSSMEDLIQHFIRWHTGVILPTNNTLAMIEAPKGEFGVILISEDSSKLAKCKVRSPSYFHLQSLPKLVKGHFLADLAALIGTIDIVFGEIDR